MNAQKAAAKTKKILVADDDQVILSTVSSVLKSHGYEVFTAIDGSQTISITRKERPDLILLDISFPPDELPGGIVPWDGFLILDWIRRMDEAKDVPVIFISGSDPAKYADQMAVAGAYGFLRKPIDSNEMLVKVRNALGENIE